MRVLIFHGYLLSGTGSNVYNASLARAMRGMGHEVHLVCQDREAPGQDWVDFAGDWDSGELQVRAAGPAPGEEAGTVSVYTPDIDGLLPVFVPDRYAGFEVKTFSELTDSELESYIERNARAVRDVVARAGEPDAALANHLVTAPLILERAGVPFAVKVHGSDLSYTVIPDLERFGPMARDGARAARGILVGSNHIAERLREAVDEPDVNAKVRPGPPGVDTDLFAAIPREDGPGRLRDLAGDLAKTAAEESSSTKAGEPLLGDTGAESSWDRDLDEAASAVRWLSETQGPRVVFVGKLIVSKGIDLLVAAWPLVHERYPKARLILCGFGGYREGIENLITALSEGDLEGARGIAHRGRALEGGLMEPLAYLAEFLADPPASYVAAAQAAAGSITLSGRLEHPEVGQLVPACDALVFPSTHPEAFGMVAAEAASAGVLPVSAAHSGAYEVSRALMDGLPDEAAGLVSFRLGPGAIESIAARLNIWFGLDPHEQRMTRMALRETAKRLWSWERVAQEVFVASGAGLSE